MVAGAIHDLIVRATDKDYPPVIHLFHSIFSIANYRQWRVKEGEPRQWLYDLMMSFFSHSQGGGVAAVTVLNGTTFQSALCRADYCHFHLLSYLITYWSPLDVVYRWSLSPRSPFRIMCLGFDTLDGISTACGLIDACQRKHPQNRVLPIIISVMLYNASGFFKWLDIRARGKPAKTWLAEPGPGVARGATYGLIYLLLGKTLAGGAYRDKVLVRLCSLVVILEILEDIFGFDLFAKICERFQRKALVDNTPAASGAASAA